MRMHTRPEIELEPITMSKPLTDLEKWKKFLEKQRIEYQESNSSDIILKISKSHLVDSSSLRVVFDSEGKFKYFIPICV